MAKIRQNNVQAVLYAVFCLIIILAGAVFLAGSGRTIGDDSFATMQQVGPTEPGQMPAIEAAVLAALGPLDGTPRGHVLVSYLIWAVRTGKSDGYIDALLNSAAAQGHFGIPATFSTPKGRLNTQKILSGIMEFATQPPGGSEDTAGLPHNSGHDTRSAETDVRLARYGAENEWQTTWRRREPDTVPRPDRHGPALPPRALAAPALSLHFAQP